MPACRIRRAPGTAPLRSETLFCQLCGAEPLERFETGRGIVIWRCSVCGLYQYGRLFTQDEYDAKYHDIYADRRRHKVDTAAARLSRLASLVGTTQPRLLDVGCSLGSTVEAALQRGWSAVGVDVSREAVEFCRARDLPCRTVDALVLPFADETFDVLTGWHVIEHVADVRDTLAEWWRVLRPGGVLALETPDASSPKVRRRGRNYRKFWRPEHTYTFTPETLGAFLEEGGFQLLRPPRVGLLRGLPARQACYALSHRLLDGLLHALGQHKAFQIFARRGEARPHTISFPSQSPALRRAA